uniref:NADH-ubiquinone oxidoreductase chain 2 n=1 Tax=Chrysomelidae sp. SPH01 TaxID=1213606 RepID=A0A0S2MPY7_9CUCU|nr:NADH deshydrogenase subunit 2 [Chrysomelidae sp. SPH01]
MLNFYKILFFSSMALGTIITISAYSWFSMWIGLEINLLSIIPLLKAPSSLYPSEASMKYFITQSLASTILLFSILIMSNVNEFLPQNSPFFLTLIMNSALLLKIGMAPFHSWFPEVIEGLNWNTSLILLTWQKLGPMIILTYNFVTINFFAFIIIASTLVSGILGLNQVSLRKIMAYSSINHMAWMLASIMFMKMLWLTYFVVYSIISLNIILLFKYFNIFFLKQLFSSMNSMKIFKLIFILNFLSLGGLPPFLGFLPKWLIMNNLIENNFFMLSIILIVLSLLPVFFYIRLSFSTLMFATTEVTLQKKLNLNFKIILFNFFSLTGLVICTNI